MSRALHEEETIALLSGWDQNPEAKPIFRFANICFRLELFSLVPLLNNCSEPFLFSFDGLRFPNILVI